MLIFVFLFLCVFLWPGSCVCSRRQVVGGFVEECCVKQEPLMMMIERDEVV